MSSANDVDQQAKARRRAEGAAKRSAAAVVRKAQRDMEREFLATLPEDGCPWWCDGRLRGRGQHDWRVGVGINEASRVHYRHVGVVEVSLLEWTGDMWGTFSVQVRKIANDPDAWRQAATDLRAAAELLDRNADRAER